MRRMVLLLIGFTAAASMAQAGQIQLTIHDGRVWLTAHDVTPRDILTEWQRVGHTRVVNGDRLTGSPVSLELAGVPEQQALDLVLRSASGFMAVPRASATAEASRFDRILILPASVAPAETAVRTQGPAAPMFAAPTAPPQIVYSGGVQRIVGADGQPVPDDQEGAPRTPVQAPQLPYGAVPRTMPPTPVYQPPGVVPAGGMGPGAQPPAPASSPVPTAPQGVAVPGMVPAPTPGQPGQPQQPGQPVRR